MFRHWAIPGKTQTRGLRIHFSEPPLPLAPWNFSFFYFTTQNSRQNKAQTLDISQNCVIIFSWSPLEIPLHF